MLRVMMMQSDMIFADEWQGLFAPFILLLLVVVLTAGLGIGVGLGIGGAAILRVIVPREGRRVHRPPGVRRATLRGLGLVAAGACGGLLLGLVLAWCFRGDPLRGPMATATLTERELFALCFFVPLGLGTGLAAGITWLASSVRR